MNPLAVFLSVVFWTWMWGFAGAFLAMPLLAIASVVNDEFRSDDAPKLPV
jgi:predicted PurR-regulated permease PerM